MKTVIFAGGLGSRISEESHLKPKPMIEIGGKPIIWHIMKIYQAFGFNEFVVCLGYKGYAIKEYFKNYFLHNSDVTVDLRTNSLAIHRSNSEDLVVTLVDTGHETKTAGRLKRVLPYVSEEDNFMLTYGDGVADIDLRRLLQFHRAHGKVCTVTAVQPAGKFGVLELGIQDRVERFVEKPASGGSWINAGFFVLKTRVFDYLVEDMDDVMWEQQPMQSLVRDGQLVAYKHEGFWKAMDVLRDKSELEQLWRESPRWKVW